ncbi:MAG: hypothetical protein RI935_410 [Candidatus Parcubacteria bacterium]|jgi:hypothetical protein
MLPKMAETVVVGGGLAQAHVDDVRVYNRAFTTREIAQLSGVKTVSKSGILTQPLSYYNFD